MSHIISSFQLTSSILGVTSADSSTITVKGTGTATISPSLPLLSTLYLSGLPFNHISISILMEVYNSFVTFTKKTIGRGRIVGGLYLFDQAIPRPLACSSQSEEINA